MRLFLIVLIMSLMSSFSYARDQINIVGSSTVYPFSTVVAERFGKSGKFKTPVIESTGTGGGMKLFCAGIGVNTPDMSNASRKIKAKEIELCKNNGVTDITQVIVGLDGIAFTKLDVLDGFKEIKICVSYTLDEKNIDYLPTSTLEQEKVKPVYEIMKGWEGSIAGVQSIDLLPNEAKDYIKKIETLINCKIIMISTSPERVDTIYLENPFEFV